MRIEGDLLVFSTGRTVRANRGIVGLSPEGTVTEGYDAGLFDPELDHDTDLYDEPRLSPAECVELGEYMAARWIAFAAKYGMRT